MEWIERKDVNDRSDLPKEQQFLGFFRGYIALFEYDEESNLFCMSMMPSVYEETLIPVEREPKITHICLLQAPM